MAEGYSKEILRRRVRAGMQWAWIEASNASNDGALLAATVWMAKIPLYRSILERLPKCPYETGKEIDALGNELRVLHEQIDPMGTIAKTLASARPQYEVIGMDLAVVDRRRNPRRDCDTLTFSPMSGTVSDISRAVMFVLEEVCPIGVDRKEALRLVAAHEGVAPVPPRVGEMTAEVLSVTEELDNIQDYARKGGSPVRMVESAVRRLRRAIGLIR